MNNRELGLQNIIKSQQSKIAQLKQQIKLMSDISQNRYSDVEKHHVQQLKQKDKLIQFLKNELANQKKAKLQEKNLTNNHYIRVKQNVQEELVKSKDKNQELLAKVKQLEIKLQKNFENYSIKLQKVTQQNKRLHEQASQYAQNKGVILVQIQKISKFYKAAMFQLPKRKQTLVWVDNLIKFMQHSEAQISKNHKELYSFMKNTISQMSKDLICSISEIAIVQQNINKDKEQINQSMKTIIEWSLKQQQKSKNQFQQISKMFKVEKDNKQKEQLFNCKENLKKLQAKYLTQIQDMNKTLKQTEAQKKTVVLALQQMKSFYQHKEQSYKEQISYLKQTISDLLDSSRFRQKQFQEEINILSSQIESISQRYYENIQFPIMKVNEKVSTQIQKIKSELIKFNENFQFKKTLDQLSKSIPHYLQTLNKQTNNNQNIQLYLQKETQLLTNSMTLIYQASVNKLHNSQSHQEDNQQKEEEFIQVEKKVKQIQWKQKQNKYLYQINVLKKHNQRLNEISVNLQKKIKAISKVGSQSKDQRSVQSYINSQKKAAHSQIQIQSLTKLNKQYQTLLKAQIQKVYKKIQSIKLKKQNKSNVYESIKQSLKKLEASHLVIVQMVKAQNSQNMQIKKNLNLMNQIIIKPTEAMQTLIQQISQIGIKNFNTNSPISQNRKSFMTKIDLNQYKQIISKRHQLGQSTSKTISELIKTIKDNFITKEKQNKKRQIQLGLQKQRPHSKIGKSSTQKKIRQIQSNQNRYRQQISHGLLKIQKQIEALEEKYIKKAKVNQTKKVQTILESKIKLLLEELSAKQKNQNSSFGQTASNALKDMQTKLKQSIIQNQGLMKQLNILHQLKKI